MKRCYTLSEYAYEYNHETITTSALSLQQLYESNDRKMIVLDKSILLKYDDEIMNNLVRYTLTEREINKYWYNPKRLSFDLYGVTEFWTLLLRVNELKSVTEFSRNPIWIPNANVREIIMAALNLEKKYIDENRENLRKDIAGLTDTGKVV